ncbi:hypothetical protein FRB97_008823, partial [Tulasnella sp. 331]
MITQTIENYKNFKLSENGWLCHADIRNFVGNAPNIFSLDYRHILSRELIRMIQKYRFRIVQEWTNGGGKIRRNGRSQTVDEHRITALTTALDELPSTLTASDAPLEPISHPRGSGPALFGYRHHSRRRPSTPLETSGTDPSRVDPSSLQLSSSVINIPQPNRSVGGGGYCDLFIGIYTTTGVKLAMKRPRFNTQIPSEAATAKRRFVREAKTWSSLKHCNILPFYGLMEISDEMYLVSPWMDYGDLSRFLRERMAFLEAVPSVQRTCLRRLAFNAFKEVDVVHGIAAGLEYLHTHEVIHGDLKALNVLLTEQLDPLICDFGMTKMQDVHNATSTAMQGAGSYRWMSPELMMDGESKTKESDIYAFGMTIVEARSGPLPTLTETQFIRAITEHQRPPWEPLSRQGQNFEPLWRIASACWTSEPSGRLNATHLIRLIEQ